MRRAVNVCRQIYIRQSEGADLVRYVREEFTADGRVPDRDSARRIVSIVRTAFCKP